MKPGSWRSQHWLVLILLFSVALRVGVALYLGDVVDAPPLLADQRSYHGLAVRLLEGHGYSFAQPWYPFTPADTPTAFWSFLYPLFLAAVYAVFGVHPLAARLVQAVLGGILLPWMVYRLAACVFSPSLPPPGLTALPLPLSRTSGEGQRAGGGGEGLLAAAIAAVYLYFVLYAATLMTETFYIVALLWSLEAGLRLGRQLREGKGVIARTPYRRMAICLNTETCHCEEAFFADEAISLPQARDCFAAPSPCSGQALQAARNDNRVESATTLGKQVPLALPLQLGLSLGLATLLRQSILPWLPFLFVWIWWAGRNTRRAICDKRYAAGVLLTLLILAAFILPWTYRNYRVYGQFLPLNSNAGYAMYSAQHPLHGTHFREFEAAPLPEDLPPGNEAQMDRALMRAGIQFVLDDPGRYALLSLSRVRAFFEFWPTPDTTLLHNVGRVGSFGLFLPFMLYGLYLAIRRLRSAPPGSRLASSTLLLFVFIVFYSLLHILTWAMVRYRLPVDAVLVLFAALALQDVYNRIRLRKSSASA